LERLSDRRHQASCERMLAIRVTSNALGSKANVVSALLTKGRITNGHQ
jgi:hypothetical protein